MDVAYYLSELLGQLGEVSVPGLGYFVQLRVDGYYNEEEATFYPPKHSISFDPQFMDDDQFYKYVAKKKNISLASSRYFTEKYITGLKDQALLTEVPLADLGWLYTDGEKLRFKPVEALANDPAFYGYPQIKINKLGGTSVLEQMELVKPETSYIPEPEPTPEPETVVPEQETIIPEPQFQPVLKDEPVAPQPEYFTPQPQAVQAQTDFYSAPLSNDDEQEEFIFRGKTYAGEDEEDKGSKATLWVSIIVILLLLAGGGLFALYKYKPSFFAKYRTATTAPLVLKKPLRRDTIKAITPVKADSIKDASKGKTSIIVDTTAKTGVTAPIDTFAHVRYEIAGGAFKTSKEANRAIKNYKKLGFEARMLKNATGKLYKVTLGTYFTQKEAIKAKHDILNTGKVSINTIGIQPYYPKQ